MPASTSRSFSNRTPEARRKAKQRVYAGLPKSPQKLVETLHDVVKTLTPRKKHLFKKLHPAESLEQKIGASVLLELKKTNTKRSKEILHYRRNLLNICQKYINRRGSSISNSILSVNRRSIESQATLMQKKTVKKMQREIEVFFESVSCPIPEKKQVSSKTGHASLLLTKPLRELYSDFLSIQPAGAKVSFAHFAKCKPKHVHLRQDWRLRMCLCEYCTNVNLKLRSLNRVAAKVQNSARIRHGYHAVDLLTCGRQNGIWRKECAYRECTKCKVNTLQHHTQSLSQHQSTLTWLKWETQTTQANGTRVRMLTLSVLHYP